MIPRATPDEAADIERQIGMFCNVSYAIHYLTDMRGIQKVLLLDGKKIMPVMHTAVCFGT